MATNAEIWQAQQAAAAERAARRTIGHRLSEAVRTDTLTHELALEAIAHLHWYEGEVVRQRRELNDEIREGQRSASSAYTDGRHDGLDEARGW